MIHDSVFPPLNQHVLREKLETLSLADLIAVTLIDSNVLLGGIFGFWENVWSEEKAVALIFNTKKGEPRNESQFAVGRRRRRQQSVYRYGRAAPAMGL